MDWKYTLIGLMLGTSAMLGGKVIIKGRKHGKFNKWVATILHGVAGLLYVAGFWWFIAMNTPWWVDLFAGCAVFVLAMIAMRDLKDGEPDGQCRIAVLLLPVLICVGLSSIVSTVGPTMKDTWNKTSAEVDKADQPAKVGR